MAKIELSNDELEILKKAVKAYQDGGKKQAAEVLNNSGINLEISEELKDMEAPGLVGGDGCFACMVCLFTAAMVSVGWVN